MFQDFTIYEVEFKAYDNGSMYNRILQLPRVMIEQYFLETVNRVARTQRPIKIELIRTEPYFDQYELRYIPQEYKVIFANNSYISKHSEEFKEQE